MKTLNLKTSDGVKIAINHFKTGFDEVVIFAPGWFMTKDSNAFNSMACDFSKNFDVIVMDFRGHGQSGGLYTFSAKEILDLKTVVQYAKKQYEKVYIIGFSLGGATALLYAALEESADKIIAVSPPHSFEKIENQMWKKDAWLPTFKKFEPKRWFSIRPSVKIHKKLKPIDFVEKIKKPTLFIAGDKDPTVHAWHTKALHEKALCEKRFELFKDCAHAEDLYLEKKDEFLTVCHNWLK